MQEKPILYINLSKDKLRRANMEAEFLRLNLKAQRLEAVWWADLSAEKMRDLYSIALNKKQYYKPLSNGEKGCYGSHIEAWKMLLASEAQALVVLEDDICLKDDFSKILTAIDSVDIEWDMIKLIGREGNEKIASSIYLIDGYEIVDYKKVPSCTTGYIISRTGAEKLIRSRIPFGRPVDIDLRFWWENDLKIFGVHPAAIILADSSADSSIWTVKNKNTWIERIKKFKMKFHLELKNFSKKL